MKEAMFYEKKEDGSVICQLCPVRCQIKSGETGRCRSRINQEGVLYALNYGKTVSINPFDPVEKKPLYHFLPGTQILSLGANYCNLRCNYCQNYEISQYKAVTTEITKEQLRQLLEKYDLNSIAFTYTEPVIWYEFVYDTSKYLTEIGYKTVLVTNGFINPEPLHSLLPYITAMNIDLKSIRDEFYLKNCGGRVKPVLETIQEAARSCHLEITNLLITDENDRDEEINKLIDFVANIDKRIPLHFSRYYPCYQLSNPATKSERLYYAYEKARQKLSHVYLGNIQFTNYLYCENCKREISLRGYGIPLELKNGKCPFCGHVNYGIW